MKSCIFNIQIPKNKIPKEKCKNRKINIQKFLFHIYLQETSSEKLMKWAQEKTKMRRLYQKRFFLRSRSCLNDGVQADPQKPTTWNGCNRPVRQEPLVASFAHSTEIVTLLTILNI